MAVSKSQKIQAEIDKVKAKISEQQARLKELEKNKQEAENSEIVDIVRGMSISLEELPLVLQRLRDGTSGHFVQRCRHPGAAGAPGAAPPEKRSCPARCPRSPRFPPPGAFAPVLSAGPAVR